MLLLDAESLDFHGQVPDHQAGQKRVLQKRGRQELPTVFLRVPYSNYTIEEPQTLFKSLRSLYYAFLQEFLLKGSNATATFAMSTLKVTGPF